MAATIIILVFKCYLLKPQLGFAHPRQHRQRFVGRPSSGDREMKRPAFRDLTAAPPIIKFAAVLAVSLAFFYLGRRWSDSDASPGQLLFFAPQSPNPAVARSANSNSSVNIVSLEVANSVSGDPAVLAPEHVSDPPPPPPIPVRFGIVDENGVMQEDFEVGDFDMDLAESVEENGENGTAVGVDSGGGAVEVKRKWKKFSVCPESMREYIPCLDNVEAIRALNSTEKGERFERHCPEKALDCLIPAPKDYKAPIPWPRSRDEVWYSNVPHTRLVEDKGGQNWITKSKDKFKFPGGATQFIHGAGPYIDQISQMIPNVQFGRRTRVVLDVGCGVASFGAFLLPRKVAPLSIAPRDVHENQIQFALERGVPAMVAAFATRRLLYPSQAFDLIHCSRCRVNWTRDDGILLLEVNRILRAGGFFVWAAQPVYKHEVAQQEAWIEMENLTYRMCWELVKKEGYLAIWRKPMNNNCYISRDAGTKPPLCDEKDNPDNVWYVKLKACIIKLPENGFGSNMTTWPDRLHVPPDRLQTIEIDSYIARKELFKAESKYWNDIISGYVRAYHWKKLRLRNVMDMRAGYGGFAAAIADSGIDAWVMNVVPTSGPNTLPVIYDRGLIGVQHDWCEPFDTYPRTYDLVHAAHLLSVEAKRCNISSIMLEMDRLVRPGGRVYILDAKATVEEAKVIADAIGWKSSIQNTSEGPYASRRVLRCDK